jgi:translocation and assembly module TamB
MKIKWLRLSLRRFSFVLLVVFSLVLFFIATTPGVYVGYLIAKHVLPGNLSIKNIHGRLLESVSADDLSYHYQNHVISIKKLNFDISLTALLAQRLHLKSLSMDYLDVQTKKSANEPKAKEKKPATANKKQALPTVFIDTMSINGLTINHEPILNQLHAKIQLADGKLIIPQLTLLSTGIKISANASILLNDAKNINLKATLKAPNDFNGKLTITGDKKRYHLSVLTNNPVKLSIDATLENFKQFHMRGNWQSLYWPLAGDKKFSAYNGELSAFGSLDDYQLNLKTQLDAPLVTTLTIIGHGNQESVAINSIFKLLQGNIATRLNYDFVDGLITLSSKTTNLIAPPLSNINFNLTAKGYDLDSLQGKAKGDANYINERLGFKANYIKNQGVANLILGNNRAQINYKAPYKLTLSAQIKEPALVSRQLEGLNAHLQLDATLIDKDQGILNATLSPGSLTLDKGQQPLSFKGGSLKATLDKKGISANAHISIDHEKKMVLKANFPKFNLRRFDSKKQKMTVTGKVVIDSVAFIDKLTPVIKNSKGRLQSQFSLLGTMTNYNIESKTELIDAKTTLTQLNPSLNQLNLSLRPISLLLTSHNSTWQLKAKANNDNMPFFIEGQGLIKPTLSGELNIHAKNFKLIDTDEYLLFVTPNLKLKLQANSYTLEGDVLIPEALLKPHDFSMSTELPDDVIFINDKKEQNTNPVTTNIKLILGDKVNLAFMGLTGKLTGNLEINDSENQATKATGQLRIIDGKYEPYGQKLTIEQGELVFSGGMIDNPGINVRASRKFSSDSFSSSDSLFDFNPNNLGAIALSDATKVGILITGRVKNPKISLYSVPSTFSQADILSMLILGRPASQASKADGQLLMTAVSALNLNTGTKGAQLTEQLQHKLGINFGMQTKQSYDSQTKTVTNTTAFVLSKALSPRLFLNYSMGIGKDEDSILNIKYLLNKYFSVQVNAGVEGSGFDVFYNYKTKEGNTKRKSENET